MKTFIASIVLLITMSILSTLNINATIISEIDQPEFEWVDTLIQKPIYNSITATVYNPVRSQCDSDPLVTADMSQINPNKVNELRWIALSRDLIDHQDQWRNWKGKIQFGDTVYVDSPYPEINGYWVVHDTMNKRYTNRIDFLQDSEKGFYGKWENITITKAEYRKEIKIIS